MKNKIKHIVIFASDSFGSYLLEEDLPEVFKMFMLKGAYTLKNRSVVPIFSSANWTSIFSGVSPSFHGRTQWNSKASDLLSIYPKLKKINPDSLFKIFKKQTSGSTAAFFRGNFFSSILNLKFCDYWTNIVLETDDDVEKVKLDKQTQLIKDINNIKANELVVNQFCEYLQNESPELSLIYVNEPDVTGHNVGHQTQQINQTVKQVALWVEQVLQAINHNLKMKNNTLFVFISDHGGKGKGKDCHGNFNDLEIHTPIFFYGQGVNNFGEFLEKTIQYDITITLGWLMNLKLLNYWQGKIIYSPFKKDVKLHYYERN